MARAGKPNKSDPRVDAMRYDIQNGENENAKKLLSEVGVDACDSYLRTALIYATFYDNLDLLAWLIDNGANINHQDRNGYSALHFAGQEKKLRPAKLLLDKGASLELEDVYGNTPIWNTLFNSKGDTQLVDFYIAKGANLDHVNKHEKTPRQMAEIIKGFDLPQKEK